MPEIPLMHMPFNWYTYIGEPECPGDKSGQSELEQAGLSGTACLFLAGQLRFPRSPPLQTKLPRLDETMRGTFLEQVPPWSRNTCAAAGCE